MNGIFKVISTILMIALICFLVWFLNNYYSQDPYQNPKNVVTTNTPIIEDKQPNISTINNDDKNEDNGEDKNDNNIEDKKENDVIADYQTNNVEDENNSNNNKPVSNMGGPFFIKSSERTSNDEKQEVLNEIDKALMDLLQVVDKVQTVDETRLGIDESEVQP